MNTYTHHGQMLKSERKRLGLTQAEAAKKVGVSREMFARYEAGAVPKDKVMYQMSEAGFDVKVIFGRIFFAPPPPDDHEAPLFRPMDSQENVNEALSWRDVMILAVDELAVMGVTLPGAKLAEFVDVLMELQELGMPVDKKVVSTQLRLVA